MEKLETLVDLGQAGYRDWLAQKGVQGVLKTQVPEEGTW